VKGRAAAREDVRVTLARLNHILIPATKTARDRYRRGLWGAIGRPLGRTYLALSEEGRVLMVFWLLFSAAGAEVRLTQIYLLWSGLTAALVVSIVLRPFFRLRGARVTVEHPPRVTVGEAMTLSLHVHNPTPRDLTAVRVDGPFLPWDGKYLGPHPTLPVLPAGETRVMQVSLRFIERGEHHLDPFHLSRVVPLGLCVGPALATQGVRFLVVPRPARVERLDVAMGLRYQPGGVALASQTGEARELAGLRPYRPGDPVRDLCPRAWARRGVPVVREYQEEYFTRFGVVLDTDVAAAAPRHLEAAIQLAAGAITHLARTEALVDLLVVGDALHRMTLGRNLGFVEQALDLLAVVRPSGPFEGQRLLSALAEHLDRLSAVVFITLAADPERLAFAARVRAQGVGVRTLVLDPGAAPRALDPATTLVPVSAVEAQEGLTL
jgi:uncharacterized protein (DUF58 family)